MLASQKEAWNICAELQKKYLELRQRFDFLVKAYREMCRKQDPDADARSVSTSERDESGVQLVSGRMVVGEKGKCNVDEVVLRKPPLQDLEEGGGEAGHHRQLGVSQRKGPLCL